jgi:hypothetical protein
MVFAEVALNYKGKQTREKLRARERSFWIESRLLLVQIRPRIIPPERGQFSPPQAFLCARFTRSEYRIDTNI